MAKHSPYAPEFRRRMIELVRAGRTPEELAKEFEPSAQAIRNWVAQADRDEGRREDGLTMAKREDLGVCGVRTASSSWSARSSQTGADRLRLERADLTDDEWAYVEPLIPPARRGGGKRRTDMRRDVHTEHRLPMAVHPKRLSAAQHVA
jgi:transposase-like protein